VSPDSGPAAGSRAPAAGDAATALAAAPSAKTPLAASSSERLTGFGRLVGPLLRRRVGLLLSVVVLGLLSAFGQNAPILLIEPLWPAMFPGSESAAEAPKALQRFFSGLRELILGGQPLETAEQRFQVVWLVAAALALIGLLAGLATYSFALLSRKLSLTLVIELRERLARHLMGLSLRYHGRRELGDLMSRVSADVQTTLFSIDLVLRDMVQEPARALVGLGIAIYAAPELTVTLLVALPLLALPVALLSKKVRRGSTRSLTSLGASVQAMTQMFLGVRTVKAFRAEERELENYRRLNQDFLRQSMKMARSIALSRASTTFLSNLGLGAMLVLIAWFVIERADLLNGGGVSMFFIGVAQAYNHLRRTTQSFTQLQEAMGAAVRLQALMDERADLIEAPDAVALPSLGEGLRFEGVGFRYDPRERPALEDFGLFLRAGESLALVGPSGSGKSTLIDLVARFIDPDRGRILVGGVELAKARLDDWSRLFAMVGQVPHLFHTTIGENIRYGRPEATQAEIEAAAKAASIHDFIVSLPEGYATNVADAGSRLSGGQRQRIAIARALLKGAPLLLLDEATSALDSQAEQEVQAALETLMQGRTVIAIAHRLSTIRNADRIAVLDQGRLVELGSHEQLLAKKGLYARLYALQASEA
jgi:subfamily B ATP-binding cassette protein MsbA